MIHVRLLAQVDGDRLWCGARIETLAMQYRRVPRPCVEDRELDCPGLRVGRWHAAQSESGDGRPWFNARVNRSPALPTTVDDNGAEVLVGVTERRSAWRERQTGPSLDTAYD